MRPIRALTFPSLLVLAMAASAEAQSPSKDAISARRFVQSFYDWYVAKLAYGFEHPKELDAWDLALKVKAHCFDPILLDGLREDRKAEDNPEHDLVGLDWDPFCASQDPYPRYVARAVRHRWGYYYVYLYGVTEKGRVAELSVIAKVAKVKGQWRFKNLIYPGARDLLTDLAFYREQRAKDRAAEAREKHRSRGH